MLNFRLRQHDHNAIKLKFVTNTTKESKAALLKRLLEIGFDISESEVFTSLTAARKLVDRKQLRPFLLLDDRAMEDFKGCKNYNRNVLFSCIT